ncbi:hypothetical protein [Sporosarcina sp. NCCP-2222]|uniref:hypothetical protein n=1 Tax=Sporosarcina sp. NCCP-2222 TaxID=2935073 RepID=UPI0020BE95E5|nr:hypothetical protein [Sporosarcina sp. NCCP-2222]
MEAGMELADTSDCWNIRVVRRRIRAVARIYEWFGNGYERLLEYTSGSTADTSGHQNIRVVRQRIRAVARI